MPVAPGGPPPLRQALLVGLGAVMTLGTVLFLVTQTDRLLGGGSTIGIEAGEPVFRPGPADELSDFIIANGPIVLQDPAGGDRDIWLNHIGPEVDEGWHAFGARPLTAPRTCSAQWRADEELFVDDCDGTTYPPDGEGLPRYTVTIDDDNQLQIRLDSVTAPSPGPDS